MEFLQRKDPADGSRKVHAHRPSTDASHSTSTKREPIQFGDSLKQNGVLNDIQNITVPMKLHKARLLPNPFVDPDSSSASKKLRIDSPFNRERIPNPEPNKKESGGSTTKTRHKLSLAQQQPDGTSQGPLKQQRTPQIQARSEPQQQPTKQQPQTQQDLTDIDIPPEVYEEIRTIHDAFPLLSSKYRLIDRIGEGTFSTVYKAEPLSNEFLYLMGENVYGSPDIKNRKTHRTQKKHYVALKRIYVTSSPQRILNELKLLFSLSGSQYVAPLLDAIRQDDQIIAVLPYYEHIDFREFYRDLPLEGIKTYMMELLEALNYCHAKRVMHRDIKPTNFLYHPFKKRGVLVDFGLAEIMKETDREPSEKTAICPCKHSNKGFPVSQTIQKNGTRKNDPRAGRRANRAGTRGFRAPEVLLKCPHQTTKIDIWSSGIILLTFLSRRFPFFNSRDDIDALVELTTIFGLNEMKKTAHLHGLGLETTLDTLQEKYSLSQIVYKALYLEAGKKTFPKDSVCWDTLSVFDADGHIRYRDDDSDMMRKRKKDHIDCFDVMEFCLKLDPKERGTAADVLSMPFFRQDDDNDDEMILMN